jgi:hypothetical protein
MDTDAARRARRKVIKQDLAKAYDDDEASPPEWVDLVQRTKAERLAIATSVEDATHAFADEPDIRRALKARDTCVNKMRERIEKTNALIRRLNLLVPHSRLGRAEIDAEETLRPLFRVSRAVSSPDVPGAG